MRKALKVNRMNSSFPNRWSFSYLKFTKYVTNIIAEPKYKYRQQEQVTVRNHNRITALERLVLKYWGGGGLNRFYGYPTSQVSQDSEQREATFNITSGVNQPKHIFVYLQRTVRLSNQEHNPNILDTFKVNADNNNCYLSAASLEVGNGDYYPELEYSESEKVRIYRDVINYVHKQSDKNTGSLLNRDNFDKLFGFLYFNLTYKSDSNTADPKQIVLRYK